MTHIRTVALAAAALTLAIGTAQAADSFAVDPIYDSPLFDFEGVYVGATAGGAYATTPGLMGTVGAVAGANFGINDLVVVGVEFQADLYWSGAGYEGYDALFLAHFGAFASDNSMVYLAAGGGFLNGSAVYAAGLGAEYALTDSLSVRGEALALGPWINMPSAYKAQLGLLWHMN